jgi:hypothetical protein
MFFKIILFLFFIIFNFKTTYANDDLFCNVELEKINHLEIPDIYKFNLLKINFIEKSKSKWEISDISLDNNLISNAKKSLLSSLELLRNVVNRGNMSIQEEEFILWHSPLLIEVFQYDYGMTTNQLSAHIKSLLVNLTPTNKRQALAEINQAEKNALLFIDNNMSEYLSAELEKTQISEYLIEINSIAISDLKQDNLKILFESDNKNESLEININNIYNNNPKIKLKSKFDIYSISFTGNCIANSSGSHDDNFSEDDTFIEMCEKSKLSDLDKDVALQCIQKMK